MGELISDDGAVTGARSGAGRDLVLVHSLLADRHAFDAIVPELSRSFRVTQINLPGFHGSKPVPATIEAYVDAIRAAFDSFGITRDAILLGNGFGGTMALGFALNHPNRIAKLILADVAAGFPEPGRQAFAVMRERVAQGGLAAIADIAANRVFHSAYLAAHPNAIAERRAVLLAIDPQAFQAACSILENNDLTPRLAHLSIPTLVICGELDQVTPPALNKIIAEQSSDAHYFELPGCGHCPPLEQPETFLRAIRDFIRP